MYIYVYIYIYIYIYIYFLPDISGITNYADIDFILLIFNSKNLTENLSIKFWAVIL